MRWISLLLLAVVTLNGCFSYVPADNRSPSQQARVRVHLSQPQEVRLSQVTANDVAVIDGEVISIDQRELGVSAIWLTARNGFEMPGENATVRIPREHVSNIEVRRPSLLKSGAIVGAAVLLAGVFARASLSGSSDGGGGGRPTQ